MNDTEYTTEQLEQTRDAIDAELTRRAGKRETNTDLDIVSQMSGTEFERWLKRQGADNG